MPTFDVFLKELLRQDEVKTQGRITYLDDLRTKAINGQLRARLDLQTEPETNYYTAPPPRQPAPGAPPIPARPAHLEDRKKALGWAAGNAADYVKSTYSQVLTTSANGNPFPIASMEVLNAIWRQLVPGAPPYRAVTLTQQPTNTP